jgi:hypothetical protein
MEMRGIEARAMGLAVAYFWDLSGVVRHIAEDRTDAGG